MRKLIWRAALVLAMGLYALFMPISGAANSNGESYCCGYGHYDECTTAMIEEVCGETGGLCGNEEDGRCPGGTIFFCADGGCGN